MRPGSNKILVRSAICGLLVAMLGIVCPAYASACETFKQAGTSVLETAKIYEYACKYASAPNSEYFGYTDDSANFASQLLLVGKLAERESYVNSPFSWFTSLPAH